MPSIKTLHDALAEVLKDDQKVSKYEAAVIREMILADNTVSHEERAFLEKSLENDSFDDHAREMLSRLLMRNQGCCG